MNKMEIEVVRKVGDMVWAVSQEGSRYVIRNGKISQISINITAIGKDIVYYIDGDYKTEYHGIDIFSSLTNLVNTLSLEAQNGD